jgi:hypothetical protein
MKITSALKFKVVNDTPVLSEDEESTPLVKNPTKITVAPKRLSLDLQMKPAELLSKVVFPYTENLELSSFLK